MPSTLAQDPPAAFELSRSEAIDDVHVAMYELMGAERRMRSRDTVLDYGMTLAQLRALVHLHVLGEVSAGELARVSGVDPGTMSATLDQLESLDVVTRRRSETDGRVVLVSLTEGGEVIAERRRRQWDACWNETLDGVSLDELAFMARMLRLITRAITRMNATDPEVQS
jgi:DNA-binding MarR family transcriptional regulator